MEKIRELTELRNKLDLLEKKLKDHINNIETAHKL